MIEVTDWAEDILNRSQEAARRFSPNVRIRLVSTSAGVDAQLAEAPALDDQAVSVGEMTLYVEAGLDGLVDIQEPHDRLVLRPAGSEPNPREH